MGTGSTGTEPSMEGAEPGRQAFHWGERLSWGSVWSLRPMVAWPPSHDHSFGSQDSLCINSYSVQSKCFSPHSHSAATAQRKYCYQRPRGPGLPAANQGKRLSAHPPWGPPPSPCCQISGAGDALQRCIENKDNMHSSSTQRPRRTKTAL